MNEERLNKALRDFFMRMQPMQSIAAKVVSVNEDNFTCEADPVGGGATIGNIRLKPVIDGDLKGVISIPVVGSYILIGFLRNKDSQPFMIIGSKFKSYEVRNDAGAKVLLKDDGTIEINGSSLGGLVKVQGLLARLQALETAFNNHTHSGGSLSNSSGVVTGASGPSGTAGDTALSDLENTKVKHGG